MASITNPLILFFCISLFANYSLANVLILPRSLEEFAKLGEELTPVENQPLAKIELDYVNYEALKRDFYPHLENMTNQDIKMWLAGEIRYI